MSTKFLCIGRLMLLVLALGALVAWDTPVYAASDEGNYLLATKDMLERKITSILLGYDADPLVIVNLSMDHAAETALPATPFKIDNLTIKATDGQPKIKQVFLDIYTKLPTLAPEVLALVQSIGKTVAPEVTVSVKPLLPGFSRLAVADASAKLSAKTAGSAATGDETLVSQLQALTRWLSWGVQGAAGFLAAFLIAALTLMIRGSRQLKLLETGFQKLADAVQDGGSAQTRREPSGQSSKYNPTMAAAAGGENDLQNFSDASLLALLNDCYWSARDRYAASVWRRIPMAKKSSLLSQNPALKDFILYLGGVEDEEVLNYERDSSYLAPAPVNHLDNETLTAQVRKQPQLLHILSTLRVDHLSLSATERLTLLQQANTTSKTASPPDFAKMTASEPRRLVKQARIEIKSTSEEEQLIKLANINLEMKSNMPSLIWSKDLPKPALEKILWDFSARDLADAWIAPDTVLNKLLESMPTRKRELVLNYQKRVTPSRQSDSFANLHARIIASLREADSVPKAEKKGDSIGDKIRAA